MNQNQLFNIAGMIWGLVGLMLFVRGVRLYDLAVSEQQATETALIISVTVSLIIGAAKGRFVLSKTARRNKARISSLSEPLKVHQVYAPPFYFLIVAMMGVGFLLRTYNQWLGGYVVVGAIYCGVGMALAVSSLYYWKGDTKVSAESEA